MQNNRLILGKDTKLSASQLEQASFAEKNHIVFSDSTANAVEISNERYRAYLKSGSRIYGSSTGFGPLVKYKANKNEEEQNFDLFEHLAAGAGDSVEPAIVKAAMIARLHVVAQGFSGVSPDLPDQIKTFIEWGHIPDIPETGSLGASGDLIPMSHIFRTFAGRGSFLAPQVIDAATALKHHDLKPLKTSGRDALSLANGISFSTATLALAVVRAQRLLLKSEELTALLYSLLGARRQALHPAYQSARKHSGQASAAENILSQIHGNENENRPLQEVYSIRCVPQVYGACREQSDHVLSIVNEELNAVSDNPVITTDENGATVLHGGNFFGQNIAFAADMLNSAITQTGVLIDRQLAALLDPRVNMNAPAMLAFEPGRQSALAGAQLTATAIVAEMRSDNQTHATFSIPSNGNNQDIVPMAATAAKAAYRQLRRLADLLAIKNIFLSQIYHLGKAGKIEIFIDNLPTNFHLQQPVIQSRELRKDISSLAISFLNGN